MTQDEAREAGRLVDALADLDEAIGLMMAAKDGSFSIDTFRGNEGLGNDPVVAPRPILLKGLWSLRHHIVDRLVELGVEASFEHPTD